MIVLTFLKELMLIKQVHQKNVIFVCSCDYLCIIRLISKNETYLMQNADLSGKKWNLIT